MPALDCDKFAAAWDIACNAVEKSSRAFFVSSMTLIKREIKSYPIK